MLSSTNFEVLIQWEEMSQENATWENGLHIIEQFPDFLLEDKGIFWGAGSDRPSVIRRYRRRKRRRGKNVNEINN